MDQRVRQACNRVESLEKQVTALVRESEHCKRNWEEGRFSGLVKSVKVGHDNHSYKEFCHGFAPPPLSQRIQDQCCSPRAG